MDDLQPPSRQKILIIRFSSIGDIVLTTPVARAIKEQLPGSILHYATKKNNEEIVKNNPYIDHIHLFNGDLVSLTNELKKENFDYVVDLHRNHRSRKITSSLKIPFRRFSKLNFRKWLTVNLKINLLPHIHIVDRYFRAADSLKIQNDGKGLDFFINEKDEFDITELPAVFEDGYVAVSVGANHATKRIPAHKIIEIAKILHKPVLLMGGSDVADTGDVIAGELGDRAFNGCGKFSLGQSASLLRQSSCVLTGDTGLMHIAAALNKPVASVWGNTIPEFGMYPYMPAHRDLFRIFEVNTLPCRPCSKLGYKKCPLRHFKCMEQISAVDIAEWINLF